MLGMTLAGANYSSNCQTELDSDFPLLSLKLVLPWEESFIGTH